MAFFNEFPNTRTYDKDLGWLIHVVGKLQAEVQTFIENNTINIPDQITWDITKQYTRNTLVIDYDGTAYLSKQPVPIGIAITNTDYWMPIFNYDDSINTLRANIATNERNHTTASAERHAGELVWLRNALYKVTADMPAGTAYIAGTNVERYTVEDYLLFLKGAIATEAKARQDADTTLQEHIDAEVLARQGADNALQGKINAEALARAGADDTLQGNIDALSNTVANLSNYATSVKKYGVVGDGTTDDSAAFQSAIDAATPGDTLYIPSGMTCVLENININKAIYLIGQGGNESVIIKAKTATSRIFTISATGCTIANIKFDSLTTQTGSEFIKTTAARGRIINCHFKHYYKGITNDDSIGFLIDHCFFEDGTSKTTQSGGYAIGVGKNGYTASTEITNCVFEQSQAQQDPALAPTHFLLLDYVDCVHVRGCSFIKGSNDITIQPTHAFAHGIYIDNCIIDSAQFGLVLSSDTAHINYVSVTNSWIGAHTDMCVRIIGDSTHGIYNTIIDACHIFTSLYGVFVLGTKAQNLTVSNCDIVDCSSDGVALTGGCQHASIVNNMFGSTRTGDENTTGLRLADTTDHVVITGNNFVHNTNNFISNSATNLRTIGNLGIDDVVVPTPTTTPTPTP